MGYVLSVHQCIEIFRIQSGFFQVDHHFHKISTGGNSEFQTPSPANGHESGYTWQCFKAATCQVAENGIHAFFVPGNINRESVFACNIPDIAVFTGTDIRSEILPCYMNSMLFKHLLCSPEGEFLRVHQHAIHIK